MLYIQTCIIGLTILAIPMLSRFHGHSADWRVFRVLLIVTMADLVCETATWLLNGQSFEGAYALIYAANLLTILLQPVMGYVWLVYVALKLGMDQHAKSTFFALSLVPLALNALMLITNRLTGFVFTIQNNMYTRGSLFWVNVIISFLYPIIATALSFYRARHESSAAKRREYATLSTFLILPIGGAIIQLVWYGTFMFLIGFAISLLIMFVNIQNDRITLDFLTKTNNRASLMYDFERKIKQVSAARLLYLFMIDVDGFKHYNDRYGHVVGDKVLVEVADRLKLACAREPCFLARLGGDEFGILLMCQSESDAVRITDKISEQFGDGASTASMALPITVSVGYAKCLSSDETIDDLISRADKMMYKQKKEHSEAAAIAP